MTARVRRDVLADRAALRLVAARAQRPDDGVLAAVDAEVTEALALFEARGWDRRPDTYHQAPPPPDSVRTRRARSGDRRYTAVTWLDDYVVRSDEPGAARYAGYRPNRIARAALVEHASDRPWLVCVHGFGMGSPGLDLRAFRAQHLHRDLGLNLAFPVLPFHGRRNPGGPRSSPAVPGIDVLDNLHGLAQAVWDVRQLVRLLRERTDQPIGLMGLSLGGAVAATVASVDEPDAVLLLAPAVDLPALMEDFGTKFSPDDAGAAAALASRSRVVMAPVTPLALEPKVPVERRAIFSGTLDLFAKPSSQSVMLWRHWEQPELHWYHGGHVSLFWSPSAHRAIDATLRRVGLASG
jgi:hypothetical protein